MLKQGYLASNLFFASISHNNRIIKNYFKNLEYPIKLIAECEDGGNIKDLLIDERCHDGFKRLN